MDFQSIAKVSPKHLPQELCREILSRLPAKSLLRFCCVSKSWLSLIKDPDFCRLHLQNFKNNHDDTHLLIVEGASRDCVVRSSNTFEKTTETLLTETLIKCVIDGLVLLDDGKSRLRIWNPSIRKFHDIPPSPKIETYDQIHETVIGLGYDALVDDYKCVKIVYGNSNQSSVAVHTLGADSWRIIPFRVKEGGSNLWYFKYSMEHVVYLWGNLYFFVELEGKVQAMGWFDVSSEVFCSIDWPEDSNSDKWKEGPVTLACNGYSSLAWIQNCHDRLTMWVFETESMCWTECYEYLIYPEYFFLKKNRDILMWGGLTTMSTSIALQPAPV